MNEILHEIIAEINAEAEVQWNAARELEIEEADKEASTYYSRYFGLCKAREIVKKRLTPTDKS